MSAPSNTEKDEYDQSPLGSIYNIPIPSPENQNQLTVSTILSLPEDLGGSQKIGNENGVIKVESLIDNSKSIESIKSLESQSDEKYYDPEKWYAVTIQVLVPFMIAGIGTIGAGVFLKRVEDYDVFKDVKALYILVPAILGLKGNLDMCLASRLSTQVNLGNMNSKGEIMKMVIGNVALVQVQAIVASFIVSIFAVSVSAIATGEFDGADAVLLAASSVLTATLSCFTLDMVLIAVILISHKFKLNPDNVATPLAASIGDLVSLIVLSTWAKLLHAIHDDKEWALWLILFLYAAGFLPCWIAIVFRNKYTKPVLYHGWVPVLSALVISGFGGLVLDSAVGKYSGYVVFQPIINGIGGNLVSVQSSRISTMLHKTSLKGVIPPHTKQWVTPWTALVTGVLPAKTARILILISIPGQTIFVFVADLISNDGVLTVTAPFVAAYLTVGVLQIMILLYIAHILVHTMWVFKIDPDNSSIPYLTAIGDLLGSTLLLVAFMVLEQFNKEYEPISNQ